MRTRYVREIFCFLDVVQYGTSQVQVQTFLAANISQKIVPFFGPLSTLYSLCVARSTSQSSFHFIILLQFNAYHICPYAAPVKLDSSSFSHTILLHNLWPNEPSWYAIQRKRFFSDSCLVNAPHNKSMT